MKILHLDSEKTWRGGQNQVRLLMEGLLERSIDVHLAAPAGSAILHRMQTVAPTLPLPMKHGLDFSSIKSLGTYCLDQGIDVIDAHSSKAHTMALFAKKYSPFLKLVVHRRVDFELGRNPLTQWKYKTKRVDRYIAISHAIGKILSDYGIADSKIDVVHSAASNLEFNYPTKKEAKRALAKKELLNPDIPWIGNVSALTDQKDYPTLFRAISQLSKNKRNLFHCIIAGDGKLAKELKALSRDLGIEEKVTFLGFRDDVENILQALDILTMPSKFEGLGTVILDAFQAGCFVVSTNVGGIPEMIKPGQTGFLSAVGDHLAFAENIEKALNSDSLRQLFITNAQRMIADEFSADMMVAGNLDTYESLYSKPE